MFRLSAIARWTLAGASGAILLTLGLGAAEASECPREQVLTSPRQLERAPDVGVSRETLSLVNLSGWRGLGDLRLRTRRLTIIHRAGEFAPEFESGHAHWWENRTGEPVVLTSSDVVPPDMLDEPEM